MISSGAMTRDTPTGSNYLSTLSMSHPHDFKSGRSLSERPIWISKQHQGAWSEAFMGKTLRLVWGKECSHKWLTMARSSLSQTAATPWQLLVQVNHGLRGGTSVKLVIWIISRKLPLSWILADELSLSTGSSTWLKSPIHNRESLMFCPSLQRNYSLPKFLFVCSLRWSINTS